MANPFKYYQYPKSVKEAQSNVNYWHYEGMLTREEMEDFGIIPAEYKTFIKEMKRLAQSDLSKLKEA